MSKFSGRFFLLTVMALILNSGVALADSASSDWNNSWGFPSSFEKANLLNQALAIELVEDGGFNVNNNNYFGGDTVAIGSQLIVDVNGDGNTVSGNNSSTDGNTAAQTNKGSGSVDQNNDNGNNAPYQN